MAETNRTSPSIRAIFQHGSLYVSFLLFAAGISSSALDRPSLKPVLEAEEEVYSFHPAENGAGPLWCSGSTCLVRVGDDLLASGLETIEGCPPLNNCRWLLFQRGTNGWQLRRADEGDRTREPSPLAAFPNGRVFLSANPTLVTNRQSGGGPAQPQILEFASADSKESWHTILPVWQGRPAFTEHSYRSFAADGPNRELILIQNVGDTHAEWAFLDRHQKWSVQGRLQWPWGSDYAKPQPIRVCYPNVAVQDRAVHFCGVSDIVEPNPKWRAYKKKLTGREWDYDFRRLFYTWSDDISSGGFHDWIEIASRESTCGWISPGDLWVDPAGRVHLVWSERALDERLRAEFFPNARQSHSLEYAVIENGKISRRRSLVKADEGGSREIPSAPRFQVSPDNRLFVVYYLQGQDPTGQAVSENRILEVFMDGGIGSASKLPLKTPFTSYFTATVRAGSAPSTTLEMFGQQANRPKTMNYARIRLW